MRNEYSLADPELYRAADKDDPEALLEGVAMAGLVGVLRQLGDLAEFAAEIFHDLHEEVMVTAARGHTLMVRVQQLESEFPPIEKAFLSQTSHSTFFSNAGTDWHPNLQTEQNLITKGDLPRFVMDSYEESRGPPRLFLLDKFDVAGAGACLKRYTDPSFYKVEASSFEMASTDVQRDKKFRKAKKKGPRWKNAETTEILPSTKLHQLFLEERVESGASDPARLVKLKRRLNTSAFDLNNGKSYMEKFLKTPPEDKVVHEVSVGSPPSKLPSNSTTEIQILDISKVGSDLEPVQRNRSPFPPPSLERTVLRPALDDFCEDIAEERTLEGPTSTNPSFDDKDIAVDGEIKVDERESYHSDDDNASEIDNYMDALATMESEVETDTEFRAKKDDVGFLNIEKQGTDSDANDEQLQSQSQLSDSQSIGNSTASDDGNSSIAKGASSFSCSDTASTSAEDTQSTEISKADVTCMSSNQDSTIEKVTVDPLPEHEVSNDAFVERAEIHVDSAPLLLPVDSRTIFMEGKSEELEPNDISSNNSEISSGPTKTEEQPTDDSSENFSGPTETEEQKTDGNIEISSCPTKIEEQPTDDNSENSGGPMKTEKQLTDVYCILQKSDDITPALSYEEHPEYEAEVEDPNVDSSTIIDSTDILKVVLEKEGSENSLEDVAQTKNAENVSGRNSVDTQVVSPDSVISHAEERPSVLPLAELGICGTCNLLEEQLAENADDDLADKFDSVEIGVVYSGERDLDGTLDGELSFHGESDVDECGIEPRVSLMASNFQSGFSESPDPPYLTNDHARPDERENETIQSEAVVQRAPDSSLAEDRGQSDERETQIVQSEAVDERAPDSSLALEAKMSLNLDNTISVSSSSVGSEQDLESESTHDSSPIEETEDGSLSRHCFPALTSLEENVEPQTDQVDMQPLNTPGESPELSSLLEPIDSPNHMDHKTGSNTDFDSFALTLPTQPPEQEKELQAEELDGGSLQVSEVTRESSQSEQVQLNETDCESCPAPLSVKASVSELPQSSSHKFDLSEQVKTPLSSDISGFNLHPEVAQLNLEEMPPLPPLPPMQWRIGKLQHASLASGRDGGQRDNHHFPPIFPSICNESVQPSNPFLPFPAMNVENSRHEDLAGNMVNSTPFLLQMPTINDGDSRDDFLALGQTHSSNPFTALPAKYNAGEGGTKNPTINHGDTRDDFLALGQTQSSNPFTALPATYKERPQHDVPAREGGMMQPTDDPSLPAVTLGPTSTFSLKTPHGEVTQSPHQLSAEVSLEKEELDHSSVVSEKVVVEPTEESVPQPPIENGQHGQPEHVAPTCQEEIVSSSSTSAPPSADDEKPNGNRPLKLPRPRTPLIDAVAAHDKSKLRKVTERVRPQVQKVEERDSLLEQIRTKSFNLKPAVATRPTIQGPRTNLRVAAILEKANAIRQAFAGSDDDDDDDNSWSDS